MMPQRDFFNTNAESGRVLVQSRATARTQQERILAFFKERYIFTEMKGRYTPDDVCEIVFKNSIPLTSVRRAMSNLTDAGELEKTDVMRLGSYGKNVHTWRLK